MARNKKSEQLTNEENATTESNENFENENKDLLQQLTTLEQTNKELEHTINKLNNENKLLREQIKNISHSNNTNDVMFAYYIDIPNYNGFTGKTKDGKELIIKSDTEAIELARQNNLITDAEANDIKVIHLQDSEVLTKTADCIKEKIDAMQFFSYARKRVLIVFDK